MKRDNCWNFKKCGREVGGKNSEEHGVCPTAKSGKHDGLNNGQFGGRICWATTGTLCNDGVQGATGDKLMSCINCEFLKQVQDDEGRDFILVPKKLVDK